VLEIAEAESQRKLYIFFGDSHYATALSNYTWLAFILKSVKAGPQQVLLTVCFASALYNNNCMAFVLTSFLKESQRVLLVVCFASALYNNNCLAFILTSYLKSVAAGPQRLQLTMKKAKRAQSGGTKRLLRFLKNFHPLRPRFGPF
jgi:hypothetical protein